MAASLSAYWVKFFKGAGFPLDVATKHAVVFSNNRIKPDMLPELDKPSLKDMGITLMGDMIAILRYAKKVVEETTCERFLVDTEDDKPPKIASSVGSKTIGKKIVSKVANKSSPIASVASKSKVVQEATKKASSALSGDSSGPAKKKMSVVARTVSEKPKEPRKTIIAKRKIEETMSESESDDDSDEWVSEKKLKIVCEDEKPPYKIVLPKVRKTPIISSTRSQEAPKKVEKRTVFDRLGDSSVTSTTNPAEASTTFNITGLGNDVLKRNSSVFNRLGDKDAKKSLIAASATSPPGILKNAIPPGILKTTTRTANVDGSTIISLKTGKPVNKTSTGTMHADHEKNQKIASNSVRQLVRTTKKIRLDTVSKPKAVLTTKVVRKIENPASKLASERVGSVPAKARLGLNSSVKQVTFDRITKVARIKKPGVFSRLGV